MTRTFNNIDDVRIYACNLLILHDLNDATFKWHNKIRTLGSANTYQQILWLSKPNFEHNLDNFELINDVILHEIAHLLCPIREGHGETWKAKCREIGCLPNRLNKIKHNYPPQKYKAVCPNCGKVTYKKRKPKPWISSACGECCNNYNDGKYTDKYKLEYKEHE